MCNERRRSGSQVGLYKHKLTCLRFQDRVDRQSWISIIGLKGS